MREALIMKHVERRARAIREAECRLSVGELTPYDNLTSEVEKERLHYLARAIFATDREVGYLTVKWPPDYDAIWANIQKNAPDTAKRRLSIHDFYQVIGRVVAAIAAGAVEEE